MRVIERTLDEASLTCYLLDAQVPGQVRPMVVVCPGGGFLACSSGEGEPTAMAFLRVGLDAAALTYSTPRTNHGSCVHPLPTRELAQAVTCMRRNAGEWGVDAARVAVCGFSAGGQVAASLGNLWPDDEVLAGCGTAEERRPDTVVLGYPLVDLAGWALTQEDLDRLPEGDASKIDLSQVISDADMQVLMGRFKRMSTEALLGHCPATAEEVTEASPRSHVGTHTPPTFVWTTFGDATVDPLPDLAYAARLHELGVPCELHVYGAGPHGLGVSDVTCTTPERADAHVATWVPLATEWLARTWERDAG